jgi:hypothetical protein
MDVFIHPRQRRITFFCIDLIAFFLRQFHTLTNWLTVHQRGATANCPDSGTITVSRQAITLFLIQELIQNGGAEAPARTAPTQRR